MKSQEQRKVPGKDTQTCIDRDGERPEEVSEGEEYIDLETQRQGERKRAGGAELASDRD